MICLGVESTAHTFGVGIVSDRGEVLANYRDIYKPEKGWGIKPIDSANHHKKVSSEVFQNALDSAKMEERDIDIISFSQGPGLPPCLQVGRDFVLDLEKRIRKPVFGVNHPVAHIEIGKLTTECKDSVILYVSGGNTQIISLADKKYRVFGETQDIGIGNALDKFARESGLGFPGGPEIERLAKKGKWVELPYTVKGMDLAFSGIATECIRKVKAGHSLEDLCFSMQETFFSMLAEVSERAMAHIGRKELLLTGGVAANKRLQEMLGIMCKERGAVFYSVPREYSGDNGAMIAWTGILASKSGQKEFNPKIDDINPAWRTDQVDIRW